MTDKRRRDFSSPEKGKRGWNANRKSYVIPPLKLWPAPDHALRKKNGRKST
jgi:hypothetical protein